MMKKLLLILMLITSTALFAKAQDTAKTLKTPQQRNEHTLKIMQKRLKLTADQSKQISAILDERVAKNVKMKGVKGGAAVRMQAITDADKKIDAVLTPEQRTKYARMKETLKNKKLEKIKAEEASGKTIP